MRQLFIASTALLLLVACGEEERTVAEAPGEEETEAEAEGEGEEPTALSDASADPEEAPPVPDESADTEVRIGPEFIGTWAANREWCNTTVATGDEQPIEITETNFGGYENQCTFQDLQPNGQDWDATLSCQGEGQQETRQITLSADEEMLTVYYHDIGDQGVTYYRCPTP